MPKINQPEDFWRSVQKQPNGCWEWTKRTSRTGYGIASMKKRTGKKKIPAHRLAWILSNGSIPSGLWVLHHCDNRRCCNPEHLYLGVHADNMRDMAQRNRNGRGRAKLSLVQVKAIYDRVQAGEVGYKLAQEYGVSNATVSQIKHGGRWGFLGLIT